MGQHPLISRILKGAFNSRPPKPRYETTWDVAQVLRWMENLGPNDSLSIADISHKLTMLLDQCALVIWRNWTFAFVAISQRECVSNQEASSSSRNLTRNPSYVHTNRMSNGEQKLLLADHIYRLPHLQSPDGSRSPYKNQVSIFKGQSSICHSGSICGHHWRF